MQTLEDYSRPWQEIFPDCVTQSGNLKTSTPESKKLEVFKYKARQIHGSKYDYSQVVYSGTHSKILIVCKEHGVFQQIMKDHLKGHGCSKCSHSRTAKGQRSNTEDFIKKAQNKHGPNKYIYTNVQYQTALTKVEIICPRHGPWMQTPANHLTGYGCSKCAAKPSDRLYIMSDGKYFKIGVSCDPFRRAKELSCRMSSTVELVAVSEQIENPERTESLLLGKYPNNPYHDCNFDGYSEWRVLSSEELSCIINEHNLIRI